MIDAVEIGMHTFWSKAHFMHNLSGKVLQFGVICILHSVFPARLDVSVLKWSVFVI